MRSSDNVKQSLNPTDSSLRHRSHALEDAVLDALGANLSFGPCTQWVTNGSLGRAGVYLPMIA